MALRDHVAQLQDFSLDEVLLMAFYKMRVDLLTNDLGQKFGRARQIFAETATVSLYNTTSDKLRRISIPY